MLSDQVVPHHPRGVAYVPQAEHGAIVGAVMGVLESGDEEQAQRVVDVVLGRLRLVPPLPPLPPVPDGVTCDRVCFSVEGTWHFCAEEHADPDDKEDLREHNDDEQEESWRDGSTDPRALRRDGGLRAPLYVKPRWP